MAHAHAQSHSVKRYTGLMDWLTTVDHKKIGILYLIAGGFFFGIGGIEAILIRLTDQADERSGIGSSIQRIDYNARNDNDFPWRYASYLRLDERGYSASDRCA